MRERQGVLRQALSYEEGFAITERLLADIGITDENLVGSDPEEQAHYLFGEILEGRMRCPFCGKTCKHTENTHRAAAEP